MDKKKKEIMSDFEEFVKLALEERKLGTNKVHVLLYTTMRGLRAC